MCRVSCFPSAVGKRLRDKRRSMLSQGLSQFSAGLIAQRPQIACCERVQVQFSQGREQYNDEALIKSLH